MLTADVSWFVKDPAYSTYRGHLVETSLRFAPLVYQASTVTFRGLQSANYDFTVKNRVKTVQFLCKNPLNFNFFTFLLCLRDKNVKLRGCLHRDWTVFTLFFTVKIVVSTL